MNKKITYYLQDLSRLDEVTIPELQQWVNEEPYSQPLRKLMMLKTDRLGKPNRDITVQNAAHHNVDVDLTEVVTQQKVEHSPAAVVAPVVESGTISANVVTEEAATDNVGMPVQVSKPIGHDMASDEKEELVGDELLEIPEALDQEPVDSSDSDILEPLDVSDADTTVSYKTKQISIDGSVSAEEAPVDVEDFEVEPVKKPSRSKAKAKKGRGEHDKHKQGKATSKKARKRKTAGKKDKSKRESKAKLTEMAAVTGNKASKKKKAKAGKKTKAARGSDIGKNIEEATVEAKRAIASKKKANGSKPNTSDNKTDKKSATVQPNRGKVVAKEIRYIYVEERQPVDFRIHEYKGESDYIRWLMSTNTKSKEESKAEKVAGKKKKKEEKKAKKAKAIKKAVLKAAEESVKKRDVIISETLADLLAGQGYDKRAKKMYKQLSLIFPEKSSYFAAKIKKLKKK